MKVKQKNPRLPLSQKNYVATDGCRCPFCYSYAVSGRSVDIDAGGATQEADCSDCGSSWLDCYALTGYIPLRRGDGNPV